MNYWLIELEVQQKQQRYKGEIINKYLIHIMLQVREIDSIDSTRNGPASCTFRPDDDSEEVSSVSEDSFFSYPHRRLR